jgi:YHS domain-containing protein
MRILYALALSCVFAACTQDKPPEKPAHEIPKINFRPEELNHDAEAPVTFSGPPVPGTTARCPVSGETFTVSAESERSVVQGKHVAFCCPECKPKFDANPESFLTKK